MIRPSPEQLTAAQWRKSSLSGSQGDCVEVAALADGVMGVRDSKDPDGGVLVFSHSSWGAFLAGLKAGEFDHQA